MTTSTVQSIHAQVWTCLAYHSIPVIPTNYEEGKVEKYLPFFHFLENLWSKAVIFLPYKNPQDFIDKLEAMPTTERIMRLDKVEFSFLGIVKLLSFYSVFFF